MQTGDPFGMDGDIDLGQPAAAADAAGVGDAAGAAAAFGFDEGLLELKAEARPVQPTNVRKKPKLTHDQLFDGETGFMRILNDFPKMKFKGKGHEFDDLSRLIAKYDRWFMDVLPDGGEKLLEDNVWKCRALLSEKEKDDSGVISDPRERLHKFRCMYKMRPKPGAAAGPARAGPAAGTGAPLSDEMQKRIEEKRRQAQERKRKQQEDAVGVGYEEVEEDPFAMGFGFDEEPQQAPPHFGGEEDDPFGLGFGLDDDDGSVRPNTTAQASAPAATTAAKTQPPMSDDMKAKMEANRQRALELKRKKQADAAAQRVTDTPASTQKASAEEAFYDEPMEDPFENIPAGPPPPGFGDEAFDDDPFGFGFGFDDPDAPPPSTQSKPASAPAVAEKPKPLPVSDEAKAKIEAARQRAVELKRKKQEEEASAKAAEAARQKAEAEKRSSTGGFDEPPDGFDEPPDEDVFGFDEPPDEDI